MKAKLFKKEFILATDTEAVSFRIYDDHVERQRTSRVGPWGPDQGFRKMSIEQARAEYRQLLAKGFTPW